MHPTLETSPTVMALGYDEAKSQTGPEDVATHCCDVFGIVDIHVRCENDWSYFLPMQPPECPRSIQSLYCDLATILEEQLAYLANCAPFGEGRAAPAAVHEI